MKTLNLPELLARCDGYFIPRTLDDFIGRQIIERQSGDTSPPNFQTKGKAETLVPTFRATNSPLIFSAPAQTVNDDTRVLGRAHNCGHSRGRAPDNRGVRTGSYIRTHNGTVAGKTAVL